MSSVSLNKLVPEEKLLAAVYKGDAQGVAALLGEADTRHPLFMGGKLLCTACNVPESNASIVQQVLEHCCSDDDADCQLYKGVALCVAVARGDPDIAQILLDKGADILGTNRFGLSPLHLACRHGNTAVVDLLIKRGAPVDLRDSAQSTPLFQAVTYGHPDVVKLLVKAGCDPDIPNEDGTTPLSQALTFCHKDITSFMLKGGSNFECSKTKGPPLSAANYRSSVLYSLIQNKDIDNVKLLLECGFRVTKQGLQQMLKSPNSIQKGKEIVELLRRVSSTPRTLKSICRINVRRVLIANRARRISLDRKIEQLGINLKLRSYVSMRT